MKAENCSLCGECNSICPVWKIVFNETVAPRGFAILEKKEPIYTENGYYLYEI